MHASPSDPLRSRLETALTPFAAARQARADAAKRLAHEWRMVLAPDLGADMNVVRNCLVEVRP